jgi:Cu(I)/Ag(I) efflux system membrane fusion protein
MMNYTNRTMNRLAKNIPILLILTLLTSCWPKGKHAEERDAAIKYTCPMHPQVVEANPGRCPICEMNLVPIEKNNSGDGSITLDERQVKLANITTTMARMENMGENILLPGKLIADQEQVDVVSARINGRVDKLFVKELGQAIKKGEPLYQLYSESLLTLQQEYLLALRQKEELKIQRFDSLLKSSAKKLLLLGLTREQLEQLSTTRRPNARATFFSAASGYAGRIDVTEGQYVAEGTTIFQIEKSDPVWVEAEVYPDEKLKLKTGDTVSVRVDGFETTKGKITFVTPEVRKGSQVLLLRAVVNNPNHDFLPGMQATVILTHTAKKVLALPTDAVLREGSKNHVWVFEKDGTFSPRLVKTGMENFDRVEITEGLKEKENVVITGAYLLHSELVLKKGGYPDAKTTH